jgi:uncharacterized protein YyaL (SSP411 family)
MNRLGRERSPYLLQHANNPVDWFAWGDEAFAKARAEDKPIFLSVGYSTCHWCHVMEHESFENGSVAAVLNEHFVSIKVDREERPDVDRVYMTFVQATTGSGGWPMSVWLTPALQPFYGGTYFPPSSRWGRPGFVEILQEIARVWRADREKVTQSAGAVTEQLRMLERAAPASSLPGESALARTVAQFRDAFDARHGGFGDAPKFPRPSELLLLLREHARTGDPGAAEMALRTLTAIADGGMRDHIGGGFHRYAVDAAWRVPHFEKMLYDQAQLVLAFLEAAQVSNNDFYARVADDTLHYVRREMTDSLGGFYSAEDADSIPPETNRRPGPSGPGESEEPAKSEGAFYLWTDEEIGRLLGDDADVFRRRYGIERQGNAPFDPQQEFTGKNLLYIARSIDEVAEATGRTREDVLAALDRARTVLVAARATRPRPHLDDKVLTAWNGLMIAAFARGARCRKMSSIDTASADLESARRAASFIRERMWNPATGVLLRRYRDGSAEIEAYAEDYAYLIFGLIELFQADPDPSWLVWAIELQRKQDELFWDDRSGGWFSTTGRDSSVLLRMKEDYDGAEPTASSVSVLNLLMLSHLVKNDENDDSGTHAWPARIDRTLRLFGSRLEQMGRAVPMMAGALSTRIAGVEQIVIVGDGRDALERAVAQRYLPFAIVLSLEPERQRRLAELLPFVAAMRPVDGKAAAYVCRDFACRAPVNQVHALEETLGAVPNHELGINSQFLIPNS